MMLEFRYDTQLLIEGENLDEDAINDYFTENFKGDCLWLRLRYFQKITACNAK